MSKTNPALRVVVISLFPGMFNALTDNGVTGRAVSANLVEISVINPREFTYDKHNTVDDRPYGGGPGMLMRPEPLSESVEHALTRLKVKRKDVLVVYMSPQGQSLDAKQVDNFGSVENLILICGRYEGVDERFIEAYVDQEWSIGDYVLSGGELPAMVLLDAAIRKIPGALGDNQSAVQDSFEGGLLDCPHYTRPEEYAGQQVPSVLMSGNHKEIRRWRLKQSLIRTSVRRPDLLEQLELTKEQLALLDEYTREINC